MQPWLVALQGQSNSCLKWLRFKEIKASTLKQSPKSDGKKKNLQALIVQGLIPSGVGKHCETLVATQDRLWSCPSFVWSIWAMIAGKLQVKSARAESGDETGGERKKKKKEREKEKEKHREKKKSTDFHQDRLSNQMGTIQELGQSGWGGTLIGQISA